MTKTIDLLHGKIMRSLCILAVPIVMTYFIQMAYNFIDMIWIGRLGSGAVAGVGVAGMFTWFSNGLVMLFVPIAPPWRFILTIIQKQRTWSKSCHSFHGLRPSHCLVSRNEQR